VTELGLFFLLGAVFLLIFIALALRGPARTAEDTTLMNTIQQVIQLQGVAFNQPARLLDDKDYRFLCSTPHLKPLAAQLREERRHIVLSWLRLLQKDVITLWRFRRFLLRNGVTVAAREELEITAAIISALSTLLLLRAVVATSGPFVPFAVVGRARDHVDRAVHMFPRNLARIPAAAWPQIERRWAEEIG